MKTLACKNLESFFQGLTSTYEVRLPILMPNGARTLGKAGEGAAALPGGPLPAKPTSFFFPQQELMLSIINGNVAAPSPVIKPLFIAGFTPRDLLCLRFIDRFFSEGFRDDLYFRLRQDAVIAAVSGYCGKDGDLIPPSNGGCDLEFVYDGCRWLVAAYSERGSSIVAGIPEEVHDGLLDKVRQKAARVENNEYGLLKKAADILQNTDIPDSFWVKLGDRCIQCTGCNLVCPTCTCFDIQDWRFASRDERSRMWDSCQLEGFAREAGGHNPMGSDALRTRRRIHHKLSADPRRWGEISCFLCGRCDAICPTNIGMVSVARALVAEFA